MNILIGSPKQIKQRHTHLKGFIQNSFANQSNEFGEKQSYIITNADRTMILGYPNSAQTPHFSPYLSFYHIHYFSLHHFSL
jgi:hypothetical protein